MSWLVWVHLGPNDGGTNACRYATKAEAEAAGSELLSRWFAPTGYEVRESTDPVNYEFVDGRPRPLARSAGGAS